MESQIIAVADALRYFENVGGLPLAEVYAAQLLIDDSIHQITYAKTITNDNIDFEISKLVLVKYGLSEADIVTPPIIAVSLPAPQSLEDLLIAQRRLDGLASLNPNEAGSLAEEYYLLVDWPKIIADIDISNLAQVEILRSRVNDAVSATAGDRFLMHLGMDQIERNLVTWDNFQERVKFAEIYLQAEKKLNNRNVSEDVIGMYHLLGNFQVTRLIEFCVEQNISITDNRVEAIFDKLRAIGANIPVTDGAIVKVLRSWNDPAYIVNKSADKLAASEALRPEWKEASIEWSESNIQLPEGFKMQELIVDGERVARVILGDPASGAKIDYVVSVGGGLTEDIIKEKFKNKTLVAEAVGAYTTGPGKPTELTIDKGKVKNYLISERDGMLIVDAQGHMQIIHREQLNTQVLNSELPPQALNFSGRLEDYKKFLDIARDNKLDVMMGHLLLSNGQLTIDEQSSIAIDKRRIIAITASGEYALVDFDPHITLLEAAVILQRAGFSLAINCDTGYYDHANVYTASHDRIELGAQDQDGTNNKLVMYRE